MNIKELFPPALLQENLEAGYVSTQTHPTLPLTIFNYTPSAQFESVWNEVTRQCRGLIVNHDTGDIIARPFAKFYNYAEHVQAGTDTFPAGDPVVAEKMDGSLGIIYTFDGVSRVATRGSFTSEQAMWATNHLHKTYPDFVQPEGVTTLVEIVYPENRIVVDYEGLEDLFLLGAIVNKTGADVPFDDIDWWAGDFAPQHGYVSLDDAVELGMGDVYESDEGVVLTWYFPDRPSFRIKVKHPRYVELHRIVTNLSTRSVHEALANGKFKDLLEVVPDEFHSWVRKVQDKLYREFTAIFKAAVMGLEESRQSAARYHGPNYTRRDLANFVKTTEYPGLCFALEDGKDISPRIWELVKPEREMAMIIEEG